MNSIIKIIKLLILNILISFVILFLLIITRQVGLDFIIDFIKRERGTSTYQGESKGQEFIYIISRIIFPTVFIIVGIIIFILKRKIPQKSKD